MRQSTNTYAPTPLTPPPSSAFWNSLLHRTRPSQCSISRSEFRAQRRLPWKSARCATRIKKREKKERKKLKTGKQIRKKEKKTRETSRVIILDNRLSEKIIVLSSHSDYIPFLSIYSPRLHSYSFNLSSYYSAWITTIYRHHSLTHPLFSSSLVCGWHLLVLLRPRRQLRPSKK